MTSALSFLKTYPALVIISGLAIGFSFLSPYFASAGNIEAILGANAVVMIAAVGMTVVFLAGGIDLSISTVISASAVISGLVMAATGNVMLGAIASLAVGLEICPKVGDGRHQAAF